jgi:predicted GH43/DUF377 family glycosyl hydrolase
MQRFPENPLITPDAVEPTAPGLEVVGTFNPAAFAFDGRVGLLVRVAERPVSDDPDVVLVPSFDTSRRPPRLELRELRRDDPAWDFGDPRVVAYSGEPPRYLLTNLSHLRLFWSDDGRRFRPDREAPVVWPAGRDERLGLEDARVTPLEGEHVVTYTAVSDVAIAPALMTTRDFRTFERRGLMFPLENKDVGLFPERIGGDRVALHRPASAWCGPGIWLGRSPDGVHWGRHEFVAGPRPGEWDARRIGAGPPPLRTDRGWLALYHGVGERGYCMGALLLDRAEPARVVARSREPFMVPETDYERGGFFNDVVFGTGLVERPGGELWMYYGGADSVTAGCSFTLDEVCDTLA